MSQVTKINSRKALVKLTKDDIYANNLERYIRTSFKGIGKSGLISDGPFETLAASIYKKENPDMQTHIAEKCILNSDNSVDVLLRVSSEHGNNNGMYNTGPNDLAFSFKKKERA